MSEQTPAPTVTFMAPETSVGPGAENGHPAENPAPAAAAPENPAAPAPKAPEPPANPWDNPETAKAEIERLRKENGAERVNAKAKAADEARNELLAQINKALGKEEEPLDPAKLTADLAASQQAAKQARVELAVFKVAPAVNGDPAALLDSTSFLKSLESVDPTDTAAVQAAISAAVEANPRLGVTPGTRTPAPIPGQGSSANGIPSQADLIALAQAAGDTKTSLAIKAQQLLALRQQQ